MRTKRLFRYFLPAIGLFLFMLSNTTGMLPFGQIQARTNIQPSSDYLFPDMGCSVIYASDGEVALGGNNEDYINPFTMAWFIPPEDGNYGRVYFGFEGFIWGGGMNDQGLFFDALGVDQPMSVNQGEKTSYEGSLPDKAMKECATVDCVTDLFSQFHTYDTWYHQFMFGDAAGNSVIIEPNQFLRSDTGYQVVTNFYQSTTNIPTCNTCSRYLTAQSMFEDAEDLSVELIRDILDAVHIDEGSPTLYSNVYDLKNRVIYLYHYHDYENVIVFQMEEELAKGYQAYMLADLFPENEDYLNWAKPEKDRLEALRAAYPPAQTGELNYQPFVGEYALPPELGLPYPFYAIAIEHDTLILKIKTDKAWLALTPISENSFYHVSSFSQFEVTFLQDESGQVNQFQYVENGESYTFTRIKDQVSATPTPLSSTATPSPPPPAPSKTATDLPTSTDEPPTISTPVERTKTPDAAQPTTSSASGKSGKMTYWWALPIIGLIILAGWLLIRRSKS